MPCAAQNNVIPSFIRRGGSAELLRRDLLESRVHGRAGYRSFLFTGHGVTKTLAFADERTGALSTPDADVLADILGARHGAAGGLELCFLNGCCTEALGRRLRRAGVPHVVCWRTETEDQAARHFAIAFYEAWAAHGTSHAEAFEGACHAVLALTRPAFNAYGARLAAAVPHYELRAREEPPRKPNGFHSAHTPLPFAAGVPLLLSEAGDHCPPAGHPAPPPAPPTPPPAPPPAPPAVSEAEDDVEDLVKLLGD